MNFSTMDPEVPRDFGPVIPQMNLSIMDPGLRPSRSPRSGHEFFNNGRSAAVLARRTLAQPIPLAEDFGPAVSTSPRRPCHHRAARAAAGRLRSAMLPIRYRRGAKPENKPWMKESMDGEYETWHCDLCNKQANEGHVASKHHQDKVKWYGDEYEAIWRAENPSAAENTWAHWGPAAAHWGPAAAHWGPAAAAPSTTAAAAAPSTTASSSSSSAVMVETPAAGPSAGQDPVLIGMPMWFAVALRDALTRAIEERQRQQG